MRAAPRVPPLARLFPVALALVAAAARRGLTAPAYQPHRNAYASAGYVWSRKRRRRRKKERRDSVPVCFHSSLSSASFLSLPLPLPPLSPLLAQRPCTFKPQAASSSVYRLCGPPCDSLIAISPPSAGQTASSSSPPCSFPLSLLRCASWHVATRLLSLVLFEPPGAGCVCLSFHRLPRSPSSSLRFSS